MASWSDALQDAEREMWADIAKSDPVSVTSTYGAVETNTLSAEQRELQNAASEVVDLADPRLAKIVRLRLVSDQGFPMWDLSYCYGILKDATPVRVRLPLSQFPKGNLNGALIEMCKSVGVFGKGLGIFDPEVISKFYG